MAQCRLFFPQSKPLAPRPGSSNYWFSTFPTGEGTACRTAAFRTAQTLSLLYMCHSSFFFCLLRLFFLCVYNCSGLPISPSPRPCHDVIRRASLCLNPLFCSRLALASISLLSSPEKPVQPSGIWLLFPVFTQRHTKFTPVLSRITSFSKK